MKKKHVLIISVFAILLLLAFAVFRGRMTREIILKKNGIPMANLKGKMYPYCQRAELISVSTDENGRLIIDDLPSGVDGFAISFYEGDNCVYNSSLSFPEFGILTIDFQGNKTVSTTVKTYADFGIFKYTERETITWGPNTASAKPNPKQSEGGAEKRPIHGTALFNAGTIIIYGERQKLSEHLDSVDQSAVAGNVHRGVLCELLVVEGFADAA
jgi:hypothetical protein